MKSLLVGGLVLLLLLGCARQAAAPQPPKVPPAPAPPSTEAPGKVGDKELSVPEESDGDALAGEDILIPPPGAELQVDDIFVDQEMDDDPISEEDFLLPE